MSEVVYKSKTLESKRTVGARIPPRTILAITTKALTKLSIRVIAIGGNATCHSFIQLDVPLDIELDVWLDIWLNL